MPDKFNGKEFVEMHGFDTYDYGARGYYAAIGRFTTIDPLAEKDYSISLYAYCGNNPVNRIDPDGREPLNILLNEVAILPSSDPVIHQKDNTESRGSYRLFFGYGQGEEGGDWLSNCPKTVPINKPIKGDNTGGTAEIHWFDKGLNYAGKANDGVDAFAKTLEKNGLTAVIVCGGEDNW